MGRKTKIHTRICMRKCVNETLEKKMFELNM